jgi:DNA repair protein RadC
MPQKVKMKIFERLKDGTKRHVMTIHGLGRTKKAATANVRAIARRHIRKNVTTKQESEWRVTLRTKMGHTLYMYVRAKTRGEASRLSKRAAQHQGWPSRLIVQDAERI